MDPFPGHIHVVYTWRPSVSLLVVSRPATKHVRCACVKEIATELNALSILFVSAAQIAHFELSARAPAVTVALGPSCTPIAYGCIHAYVWLRLLCTCLHMK